jgi:choline-sulfatase
MKSLFLSLLLTSAALAAPLNILEIVTDDQATWTLGCYGNTQAKTPHLDQLAAEGVRFDQHYVATPVCSPARAEMLTGKLGLQVNVPEYLGARALSSNGLAPGSRTWFMEVEKAGYATAFLGKWHVGKKPIHRAEQFGVQHFFGAYGGGCGYKDLRIESGDEVRTVPGFESQVLPDEAMRWIGEQTKPWALSLRFIAPHAPYGPLPAEDTAVYEKAMLNLPPAGHANREVLLKKMREYFSAVHSVDRAVGRLVAMLKEKGLWDKTVIVFTSDHGYNLGHHGVEGKGNARFLTHNGVQGPCVPNMWDHSLRTPLIIRSPGSQPGKVITAFTSNLDFFSSYLSLLGVPQPADWKTEGMDFSPFLRGETPQKWRDAVYGQYDLCSKGLAYMRSVRTTEWKYVRFFHQGMSDELYDLKKDPEEQHNLIKYDAVYKAPPALQAVEKKMRGKLHSWLKAVNDPILTEKREGHP